MSSTGLLSPFVSSSCRCASGLAVIYLSETTRGKLSCMFQSVCDSPLLLGDSVVRLHDTMYDGNIRARNLVHRDISRMISFTRRVREEQQVAAIERGLHGATTADDASIRIGNDDHASAPQDHNYRRLRVAHETEPFPNHQPGGKDRREVQDLEQHLRQHVSDRAEPEYSRRRTCRTPSLRRVLSSSANIVQGVGRWWRGGK